MIRDDWVPDEFDNDLYLSVINDFFFNGKAPSQIDKKYDLDNGTSKGIVIRYWRLSPRPQGQVRKRCQKMFKFIC